MNLDADKIIEKYKTLLSETTHRVVLLEEVIEEKNKEISKLNEKLEASDTNGSEEKDEPSQE